MDSDNFLHGAVATTLICIVASFSSCTVISNNRDDTAMEAMVAKGADPLAARCAVHPTDNNACSILAAKR